MRANVPIFSKSSYFPKALRDYTYAPRWALITLESSTIMSASQNVIPYVYIVIAYFYEDSVVYDVS